MNTKIEIEKNKRGAEDFRKAISSTVFVQAKHGAVIVGNEHTGTRDPWMFDFRALMLQPKWLTRYAELFWERYQHKLPFQVGGIETAGIALVAAIVMKGVELGHPVNCFYVRKSRKRQGLMKYIEGTLTDEPVILVDDLMNSGQSVNKQIDILTREGREVTDVFVILTFRTDDAYAFLKDKNVTLGHLFTLPDFGIPLLNTKDASSAQDAFRTIWHYTAPSPSFHLVVQKSAPVLDAERIY
ncbi:MAG: quinonprotein alcohol dehydrogenase, partial [Parcubacteria group bacterium Athens0416_74]